MLLCQTHAALIDRDVERFTVEALIEIRAKHEEYVSRQITGSPAPAGLDLPSPVTTSPGSQGTQATSDCATLLSRAQSGDMLSRVIADVMALAIKLADGDLRMFCEHELGGYPAESISPPHRKPKMFLSVEPINMQYFG